MNNPLETLLNPTSIAVVGATNNPTKMGMLPCLSIMRGGYTGRFYPVSKKEPTILGTTAYPTVADLPEVPDLGIIIIPTEQVIDTVRDFGEKGTRRLVIVSAGFKEMGAAGREHEARLIETAARYGIRFVGPNCLGVINTGIGLNTSGMSVDNRPGMLGFLSHSGTYVAQTADYLNKRGVRFSKAVSLGNEANIDMTEALAYLGDDEQTRAVSLYIEGIRDVARFIETARRVAERKPVLAHYSGGSTAGARSGASHTGAMAGPDHLFDGIFRQAGIIRVHSIEDLYLHGWALAAQPPLRGNRVGIITNSGGPGTSAANACNLGGLDVPAFTPALQNDIRQNIFEHASGANPVDVTFTFDIDLLTSRIPEQIVSHGEADGFIIHGAFTSGFLKAIYHNFKGLIDVPLEAILAQFSFKPEGALAFPAKHGVPVLYSSFFDREDNYTEIFQRNDIPVFDGPEKAAGAMLSMRARRLVTERPPRTNPAQPAPAAEARAIIADALQRGEAALDEHRAKKILAAYGVPVSRETLASTENEAVAAAGAIGYPVVCKACGSDILHKTGKGLIYTDLTGDDAVRRGYGAITAITGGPVLVQEMVSGKREFMAGMKRFAGFGPAVLFGYGGIFAEAVNDTALRVPPFAIEDAAEMMAELRTTALLGECRGMPAADVGALARIIQTVGFLALLHPEIQEMDCNPIILRGAEPVVVDALMVL